MSKDILTLLAIVFIIFLIFFTGVKRHEEVECLQWQKDARSYQGYYLLDWQVEQCQEYGIIIN
jgi:hypothetical protein